MTWKTLEEIKDFFKIDKDKVDLKVIRDELLQSLAQIHPDKNGGDFKSGWQKEQYNKLKDAVDFIDQDLNKSTSLITVESVTDIIEQVTQAIIASNVKPKIKKEIELKENYNKEIRKSYSSAKISSGSISAICTGLLTFSEVLNENPIFSPIYEIPYIKLCLLVLLIGSMLWLVVSWINEKSDEKKKEWLFSEIGKLTSHSQVTRSSYAKEDKIIFGLLDYVNVLREQKRYYNKNKIKLFFIKIINKVRNRANISFSLAEDIAKYHLLDFENRGILKKSIKNQLK